MKYKIVALDLDGTLTNSEKKITPRTKHVIKQLRKKNVKIVLASGRPLLGISHIADELGLDEEDGYILAYNGGKIIQCRDNKTIFEKLIPVEIVKKICHFAKERKITALSYDLEGIITENPEDEYVKQEAFNNSIGIRKVDSLEDTIEKPIEKIMLVGNPQIIKENLPVMQRQFAGVLNIFCSEPYFLEVMPLEIEKANSLQILLDYLAINREELMACGDGLNDIPMIKYAGMGVAMKNACHEVKRCANYITDSNDEDGVAKAIEKLIFS